MQLNTSSNDPKYIIRLYRNQMHSTYNNDEKSYIPHISQ